MKMLRFAVLFAMLVPASLFAQERSRDRHPYYGNDRPRYNSFELTPFGGYRWGGTIYSDQSNLFNRDVDLENTGSYGVDFAIPIASSGLKLELLANRQNTHFVRNDDLFEPNQHLGDFHVTYYHAGLQIPLDTHGGVTPFAVVSAGVATLDPEIPNRVTTSDNRFSASVGFGVKVPISNNVGIRLEGRGFYTATSNENSGDFCSRCTSDNSRALYQGEVNAGITFKF